MQARWLIAATCLTIPAALSACSQGPTPLKDPKTFVPLLALVALLLGGCLALSVLSAAQERRRKHILANGRTLKAWLVQANTALFQPRDALPGFGHPAEFLISFDEAVADEELRALARRLAGLKGQRPSDPAERKLARMVTDETYRPGARRRLPRSFTGGPVVYDVHLVVEIARLPARRLDRPFVYCKAFPGDTGWVFMTDYPPEAAAEVHPPEWREFSERRGRDPATAEATEVGDPSRTPSGVRIRDEEPARQPEVRKDFALPRAVKIVVGSFFVLFSLPVLAVSFLLWDDCRFVGWEPQPMTAAGLVASGPGGNHFVRISNFVAGDPVLVPFPVGEPEAWFPVYLSREQKATQKPPIVYRVGAAKDKKAPESPRELTGIVDHAGDFLAAPRLHPNVRAKFPQLAGETPWIIRQDQLNPWMMAAIFTCVGLVFLGGGLMLIRGRVSGRREQGAAGTGEARKASSRATS
jgi:hypothetical protein